ncbi:MAG: exodeoxyribonuclease VII small subunit [Lachnospiraceae bacterium]|nr:exodeoxyribonuclease VII small subunit [Lachnospiraceae bacterium]MCR4867438.1 exodeoxyribonuclease VII small subunit [Lachnospiraceae bacterium]
MEEKRSLEEMLSSLEECVNRMESGELSLEQSFEAFKEGIELVKQCNESIDMVEKEVVKLMDDGSIEPLDEVE